MPTEQRAISIVAIGDIARTVVFSSQPSGGNKSVQVQV
jgi:hypothetical protein